MLYFPGNQTVTPYEFVRVDLTPEVPVLGEQTLVTCTANVPDVRRIEFHLREKQGEFRYGYCVINNLKRTAYCYVENNVSMPYKQEHLSSGINGTSKYLLRFERITLIPVCNLNEFFF